MKEFKIPIFESYMDFQEEAKVDAHYLNSVIAPQLRERLISINLGILIDASENPSFYGLQDTNKNPLEPRKIKGSKFLAYTGSVVFDSVSFESWYHTMHPDGIKRKIFFNSLSEDDKKNITYNH